MQDDTSIPPPAASLWRRPDFIKLWTGLTISELGSRITRDGLPLAAVMTLGATPAQMGLLTALGTAPALLLGLAAGAWVDRLRRRPILIAADLGRAALLLTIPAAALAGRLSLAQLTLVLCLAGVLGIFFDVAYPSYLPGLVTRASLLEANSKLALSGSLAEVLGPGLAGILIQLLTAPLAIFFDALSFLVSALSLGLIHQPEPAPPPARQRAPLLHEVVEGLRFVAGQPLLRAFALVAGTQQFFGNFYGALYGYYAIRTLGLGPAALGLSIAMGGVGSLAASLLAEPLARRLDLRRTLLLSLLGKTIFGLLTPLAGGPAPLAAACLMTAQLFGDLLATVYFIHEASLRQAATPDRLLGRMNATQQFLRAAIGLLGALAAGLLAEALGVRLTLLIAVLGGGLGGLWLWAAREALP